MWLNPSSLYLAMDMAITRRISSGQVLGPAEAVLRTQVLWMMTRDAARLHFDEAKKGTPEAGKLGDLLDNPLPLSGTLEEWHAEKWASWATWQCFRTTMSPAPWKASRISAACSPW
jgi:hypothetical protein